MSCAEAYRTVASMLAVHGIPISCEGIPDNGILAHWDNSPDTRALNTGSRSLRTRAEVFGWKCFHRSSIDYHPAQVCYYLMDRRNQLASFEFRIPSTHQITQTSQPRSITSYRTLYLDLLLDRLALDNERFLHWEEPSNPNIPLVSRPVSDTSEKSGHIFEDFSGSERSMLPRAAIGGMNLQGHLREAEVGDHLTFVMGMQDVFADCGNLDKILHFTYMPPILSVPGVGQIKPDPSLFAISSFNTPILVIGDARSNPDVHMDMAAALHPSLVLLLLMRLGENGVSGAPTYETMKLLGPHDLIYTITQHEDRQLQIFANYPYVVKAGATWSFACVRQEGVCYLGESDRQRGKLLAALSLVREHTMILRQRFESVRERLPKEVVTLLDTWTAQNQKKM